jgi:hypothetical protein
MCYAVRCGTDTTKGRGMTAGTDLFRGRAGATRESTAVAFFAPDARLAGDSERRGPIPTRGVAVQLLS